MFNTRAVDPSTSIIALAAMTAGRELQLEEEEDLNVPILVLRLGSPRKADEGLRLGTVRRPPRGVPKAEFATRDYYDVWLPALAPSQALMTLGQRSQDARSWIAFERKFRAEMNRPDAARLLDLLAALSHQTSFSVGCYCENEQRCHRSILRKLLAGRGADFG
ncbi:MAG TPA: DUF488 family protein [Vicinamibacterales bacterium]|nr:DUF488 family protein [Vicinamibacterales bacterium]